MTICVYDVIRQRNFFTTLRAMIRITDLCHETKHITTGIHTSILYVCMYTINIQVC